MLNICSHKDISTLWCILYVNKGVGGLGIIHRLPCYNAVALSENC